MPSVPWKVEFSKIFKFSFSKFQKCPKSFPNVSKRVLNVFWGQIFEKKLCPEFHGGSNLRKFSKKSKKISKNPKMPKIVPKSIQTCFELVLGQIFRKIFLPSVPWRFESSKTFLKIKKFSKFQKCPKSFPKVSKRVLNMFWGKFFEKNFAQFSMECRVFENFQKKYFEIPKRPKIVPKSIQTCFECVLGQTFRKILCPVFHGGSSLRKFS